MRIIPKVMKKKWGSQVKLNFDHEGTQGIVFVALDGWDMSKYENREGHKVTYGSGIAGVTKGKQIRLSMNSPLRMTYMEWRHLVASVEDAYAALQALASDD